MAHNKNTPTHGVCIPLPAMRTTVRSDASPVSRRGAPHSCDCAGVTGTTWEARHSSAVRNLRCTSRETIGWGNINIDFWNLLDIEPLHYMILTQNRHLHPITLDHKCPEFVVNVGSDPSTQFVRPRPVLTSCIKSATSQGFSNFS